MVVSIAQEIGFKVEKPVFVLLIPFLMHILHIVQVILFSYSIDCDVAVISGQFSDDISQLIYTFEYDLQFNFPLQVDV